MPCSGSTAIILVITGLFASDAQIDKADGLNINIVAGIVHDRVAAAFIAWARLRPIVVPTDRKEAGESGADGEAGRPVH